MIDRRNHVTLGRQILGEPGHESSRAWISVGNNYQRKGLAADGFCIAECLTQEMKGSGSARPWCPGHATFVDDALFLTRRDGGRVPDLNGERAIGDGRLAGIFVEAKNVRLMRIHKLNGTDSYRPRPARRQFRRVHWRYAEVCCRVLLGEAAGAYGEDAQESHLHMLP